MPTATAIQPTARPAAFPAALTNGANSPVITWEDFEREYLSREDEYKYEWVEGRVVKTKRSMHKTQLYILLNLLRHFESLRIEGKVFGQLVPEPDLFFLANHRRPDFAWLTDQQIYALADPAAYEVPAFIIEVVSTNDQIREMKDKMKNYRDAGVQVVWHIHPIHQEVDIYSGKNLSKSKVCTGRQICSAAPVLPAFAMSVSAIFKKQIQ
ncbi:MAG: Uma2 family endonuclease [Bacteroidota bacterium]